jgi:hypothetical protein
MISYFSNSNLKKKKEKKNTNYLMGGRPATEKLESGRTTLEGLRGSTTRHSRGVAPPPESMGGQPPT